MPGKTVNYITGTNGRINGMQASWTNTATPAPPKPANSNTTANPKEKDKGGTTKQKLQELKNSNTTKKLEANKGKVQTAEGPEEFDVLPDAANLEAINAEYVPHIYTFNVNPETVHSVYGTADLKKIRMALDEE